MEKYDVIIIGGGVSGLSCAITLGSANNLDEAKNKKILILDEGKSHLNIAKLNNVAGVEEGTIGRELLESLKQRATKYDMVSLESQKVVSVSGQKGNFEITTEDNTKLNSDLVVFANGMQTIEVEGIGAEVVPHIRAPRPGMVMIENNDGVISEGKYVTGCAAGASSMYSSAAGYGAQCATDIISSWVGKYTVIHDVAK